MADYYNNFRPLSATAAGRGTVRRYGLPPFIDATQRYRRNQRGDYRPGRDPYALPLLIYKTVHILSCR
jgi:hypothetical protein